MLDVSPVPLASRAVQAFIAKRHRLFIDGDWRDAADGSTFDVFDPATGRAIAKAPQAALHVGLGQKINKS